MQKISDLIRQLETEIQIMDNLIDKDTDIITTLEVISVGRQSEVYVIPIDGQTNQEPNSGSNVDPNRRNCRPRIRTWTSSNRNTTPLSAGSFIAAVNEQLSGDGFENIPSNASVPENITESISILETQGLAAIANNQSAAEDGAKAKGGRMQRLKYY